MPASFPLGGNQHEVLFHKLPETKHHQLWSLLERTVST